MILKRAFSIFLIVFLFLNTACNDDFFFSSSVEFDDKTWNIDENALFKFQISEPDAKYAIFIDYNCEKQYLTENIWLEFAVKSPGNIEQKDTVMYLLTDKNGKWFGKEKSKYVENKFLYKNNISFPASGDYSVKIRHLMRENDLPAALSVGISIVKHN